MDDPGRGVIYANSVVLASTTKGTSHSRAVDRGATMLHLVLALMRTRVWWEYVESHASWSDRLSRDLDDPWLRAQGFVIKKGELGTWPWDVDDSSKYSAARAVVAALG